MAADEHEPCYDCRCCTAWARSLELLREHVKRHVATEVRIAPCHDECLVCAEVEWQLPTVP